MLMLFETRQTTQRETRGVYLLCLIPSAACRLQHEEVSDEKVCDDVCPRSSSGWVAYDRVEHYADSFGAVSTDRFGYTGTAIYYPAQSDYLGATNGSTINIGDRDLSLYILNGYDSGNMTVVMGLWWYATDPRAAPVTGTPTATRASASCSCSTGPPPPPPMPRWLSPATTTNWTTFNLR